MAQVQIGTIFDRNTPYEIKRFDRDLKSANLFRRLLAEVIRNPVGNLSTKG
jgi:hypothetical protein